MQEAALTVAAQTHANDGCTGVDRFVDSNRNIETARCRAVPIHIHVQETDLGLLLSFHRLRHPPKSRARHSIAMRWDVRRRSPGFPNRQRWKKESLQACAFRLHGCID